jgi:hypothetical protein
MEGVTDLGMLLYPPLDLAPTLILNDDGDGGGTSDDFDNNDNDNGGANLPCFYVGFTINIYMMLLHTPLFPSALSLSYHRLSLMRNHHQLIVVFEQAE